MNAVSRYLATLILQEETSKMDVFLPVYQELHPGPKFPARLKQWSQTLALPEDAAPFLLEVAKFLGTVALFLVSGLILLMAG